MNWFLMVRALHTIKLQTESQNPAPSVQHLKQFEITEVNWLQDVCGLVLERYDLVTINWRMWLIIQKFCKVLPNTKRKL